ARRGAVHAKEQQIQQTVTRLAVARQIQVNGRQWIRQLVQAEQDLSAKLAAQEGARQALLAEGARLQERLQAARQAIAEQEVGYGKARGRSQELAATMRQAQEQLLECHTQLVGIANQTQLLVERTAEDERRRAAVESQLAGVLGELQVAQESQAERRERAAHLGATLVELQAQHQRLAEQVQAQQGAQQEHQRQAQDAERALLECRSRLRTLSDIQSAYQGYGQAVRHLMQALAAQPQRMQELGVLGPLAELLRLPPPLAAAVGEHLGPYLEVIVVRQSAQLPGLQAELQALGLAGVRCVAMDALPPLAAGTLATPSTTALAGHVQLEPELAPLRQALFGAVRLLPAGTPLLPLPPLEGASADDWLAEDGSFHVDARRVVTLGRPASPTADILRRRNELDALQQREAQLVQEDAVLQERSRVLAEQGAQLEAQRLDLERQHGAAMLALRQLEGDMAHAEREMGRLRQVVESQQAEQARYQQSVQRYQAEQAQLAQSEGEWRTRQRTLEESLAQRQSEAKTAEEQVDGLGQRLSACKLEQGTVSVELSAVEGRLSDLAGQGQELAAALQKTRGDLEQHGTRMKETEQELQALEQTQTTQHEELATLRNLARQAAQGHDSQEQHRKELEQAGKAERQALDRLQEQVHQMDLKLSQEVVRRDQWAAQLPQGLAPQELLPAAEAAHGREATLQDERALEGQLASTQGRLRQMEGVNLAAPDEYDALTTRLGFLSVEKADLERAMADLETSIRKMNQESRRRFKETFERVNEKFQELFPKVFGGGEARLVLTDSDDPLLAGVDIVAQPPGKKLQGLNLLSGGEKALTAISLIFSFFLIKPSPFCLLDEVDAPLDEANVGRFNRLIQTMTGQSQFIIITHNKRTMEIGDLLYGVTMEEAGVSKIVSVSLAGLA
ncbi:MAG TPA: hypothetical protein VL359_11040, partial [bacterium]|nr:hypothetical protein [bacterium]